MSITGFQPGAIQQAVQQAVQRGKDRQAQSMSRLSDAAVKIAEACEAMDALSKKMEGEAAQAMAELAQFTNGGPELDGPTPLPVVAP